MKKVTLGGERLGSGKKEKIMLHGYERSTHDLSYIWKSTAAAGTLIPFMVQPAMPGDTFDIMLDANVMTHPTLGPLFGSFKLQLDVFEIPMRLYMSALHNNMLGIGNQMQTVYIPKLQADPVTQPPTGANIDNAQINPSSILAYLGIRGWGYTTQEDGTLPRKFNAIPLLAYWEIFKNYYANKQEDNAYYILPPTSTAETITLITVNGTTLPQAPTTTPIPIDDFSQIQVNFSGATPDLSQIKVYSTTVHGYILLTDVADFDQISPTAFLSQDIKVAATSLTNWDYAGDNTFVLEPFALSQIDDMRTTILQTPPNNELILTSGSAQPYRTVLTDAAKGTQCGLAVKTYQSDLLNNWIQTEWLDGVQGINTVTAIDTSEGNFQINSLILARKVFDLLNRVAISGGSYNDWISAVYDHVPFTAAESPMYHGGLSKEVVFQQVVSTASADQQPLGTLGGRGQLSKKHKGGQVHIKINEHAYIIGIVSLTPRLDYSQGNRWDSYSIATMNDWHKPQLDEIGFQELITEQMAWWDTHYNTTTNQWGQQSAGKQPAWINYMTEINRTYGNFAEEENEMFMTLNRRYEFDDTNFHIKDVTTYIDPSKYNFIFAQTSLDAQNFWLQIACDITARRKMSAKVMPNL